MKKLLICALILFAACRSSEQSESTSDSVSQEIDTTKSTTVTEGDLLHDSDYGIYHFPLKVNSNVLYSVVFHTPDKQFVIYNNADETGDPISRIPFSDDINYEKGYFAETPDATFSFLDYNFDGNRDIGVLMIAGTGNTLSDIYLFDSATGDFKRENSLSEYSSLEVDSVNHVLTFHNSGGMGGAWYTAGQLAWVNRQLQVIRKEVQSSLEGEDEIFVRTIEINENGKWKVASKVRLQKGDDDQEKQCLLEGGWEEFDRFPNLIFATSKEKILRSDGRNGSCN